MVRNEPSAAGLILPKFRPQDRLCRTAGGAAPSGGSAVREATSVGAIYASLPKRPAGLTISTSTITTNTTMLEASG